MADTFPKRNVYKSLNLPYVPTCVSHFGDEEPGHGKGRWLAQGHTGPGLTPTGTGTRVSALHLQILPAHPPMQNGHRCPLNWPKESRVLWDRKLHKSLSWLSLLPTMALRNFNGHVNTIGSNEKIKKPGTTAPTWGVCYPRVVCRIWCPTLLINSLKYRWDWWALFFP